MAVSASGTYSLLGINADSITTMQQAIRDYKQGVDEPLSQLSANVDYAAGFKGSSIAESLKSYLESYQRELIGNMDLVPLLVDEPKFITVLNTMQFLIS